MFHVYVLFLILSGVAMLVMAFVRTGAAKWRQVLNFVFGAGFTIDGLYLLLDFNGGHYVIFFKVFVVPVLLIVQFFRDRARSRRMAPGPAAGGSPSGAAPWATGPGAGNGQAAGPQGDRRPW